MNGFDRELYDFANDQSTVDFIVRANQFYINELQKLPGVELTQTLSDFFIIGYSSPESIDKVASILGTNYLYSLPYVMGLMDKDALDSSGISQVQEQPLLDLRGRGVIVGFVDTGIDYTLPTFRYENGESRIISIYDQSLAGDPPDGFIIGSEFSNSMINEALRSDDPFSVVPHRDIVGHGTFLASVAAGKEQDAVKGAAPESELIVVKLKKARPFVRKQYLVPEENENVYESSAVMLGIEYILKKAQELDRPVAICLGVGTNQGTHDSYGLFEQFLGLVANITGVCICAAAGNESQERHHTRFKLGGAGSTADIEINVKDGAKGVYMTILNSPADRVSVSLKSPTGELIGRIPAKSGTSYTSRLILEKSTVTIEYNFPLPEGSGQEILVKIEDATAGIWTVTVYGDIVIDGTVDAYLPVSSVGYPGIEFTSPDPNYTVTVPASNGTLISCGGYDNAENRLYTDTSWGPTRQPQNSPDLVAPGVRVTGIYPTGIGTNSGTSVAAAITTGACALMLQWGIVDGNYVSLNTFQIKDFLIKGCSRDGTRTYPNQQWGYGRLDLYNSFNLMRET